MDSKLSARSNPHDANEALEDAVVGATKHFLQLLDSDQAPSIEQFCQQFPEIAGQLGPTLEGLAMVHRKPELTAEKESDTLGRSPGVVDKETLGKPIGDFQIVKEIGRGGMGVVYEAIQLSLNRAVALKVLPFASGLDKVRLQRFRNESHAAAGLHHTNIVPVFAVGSDRGIHYYAMQLIDGHTLTELIERMRACQTGSAPNSNRKTPTSNYSTSHASRASSPQNLDETFRKASTTLLKSKSSQSHFFESVVAMITQAARALEHAHQYGVIHRDIKPGNLLLDNSGKIWITDFGLAQIQHADWQLTHSGDQVGTLRYMSPEQAKGDRDLLDHRCDIYSLGVTLYELLTLRPAIDGDNYRQMLNQVAERDPVPIRTINAAIPLDLDTIVRKAIAKEPSHRYSTAQALADDLQRWLDNKPIAAKPPTVWQRMAKWRKRNSVLVNTAGVLLLLLSAGLMATTLVVLSQQRTTTEALNNEIRQRFIAQQNFQQARQAVDTFSELSENELAFRPEAQSLRRRILETSLAFYGSFLDQHKDDLQMSAELKSASEKVERILGELQQIQEANLYSLLDDARVWNDLGIANEQANELEGIIAQYRNAQRLELGELQYESDAAATFESMKRCNEGIRARLTEGQFARLKQISLQLQLPFTLVSDEVVKLLDLSPVQRQQIHKIIAEHRPDNRDRAPKFRHDHKENGHLREFGPQPNPRSGPGPGSGFSGGPGPGFFGPMFSGPGDPKMNEIRRATVEHILRDALNSAQREKWTALIGQPFGK